MNGPSNDGVEEVKKRIELLRRELYEKEKDKTKIKTMFMRDIISETEMVLEMERLNKEINKITEQINMYSIQIETHLKEEMTFERTQEMLEYVNK